MRHSGEADQETWDKFETWLHGDRAHKAAYREFEQVYLDLDFVAAQAGVNLDNALTDGPQFALRKSGNNYMRSGMLNATTPTFIMSRT